MSALAGKTVFFHWTGWHGKDGPSIPGYDSRDANVIGDQLSAMETLASALGAGGFGVVALTYGPTVSTFIHAAVMEMSRQCSNRNVPFALCFDPWTVRNKDKNTAMIAALQHPDTQVMLAGRSYLAGKPVLDFSTGCDPKTVLNAVHGIQYWMKNVDYSWPETTETIPTLAIVQALPTMKLPCVMSQFNDGTGADRNKSVWDQTKPARIVPPLAGKTFWDMVELIPKSSTMVQAVTWNDYKEGTNVEQFASMLWGRIGG